MAWGPWWPPGVVSSTGLGQLTHCLSFWRLESRWGGTVLMGLWPGGWLGWDTPHG